MTVWQQPIGLDPPSLLPERLEALERVFGIDRTRHAVDVRHEHVSRRRTEVLWVQFHPDVVALSPAHKVHQRSLVVHVHFDQLSSVPFLAVVDITSQHGCPPVTSNATDARRVFDLFAMMCDAMSTMTRCAVGMRAAISLLSVSNLGKSVLM
eukprot:TRINITY_DN11848_c1_g2_i3.p2 TRINITY_DN11848_c1_g2~~TRINITY_DN11848_c1_g2_i3.p2  ORF type:complete len:152 (-),score=2.43 TRINITY_DN11848_c1_g2_i3:2-457(-)